MLKICWLVSKVSTQLIALLGSVTLAVVELLFELGHGNHRLAIADVGVGTSKFFGFGRQRRHIAVTDLVRYE